MSFNKTEYLVPADFHQRNKFTDVSIKYCNFSISDTETPSKFTLKDQCVGFCGI